MRFAVAILLAQSALSQSLPPTQQSLRCTVEPIGPILLYAEPEIATGYTYSLPLARYTDGRPVKGWSVIASFTPQGAEGPPTVLERHIDGPSLNQTAVSGSTTYWVGLGTYSVKLAMSDDHGAVCRKEWSPTVEPWPKSGKGSDAGGIFSGSTWMF